MNKVQLSIAGFLLLASTASFAQSGLFFAYKSQGGAETAALNTHLQALESNHDCKRFRQGGTFMADGTNDWESENRFLLLQCEEVVPQAVVQNLYQSLMNRVKNLRIVEGKMESLNHPAKPDTQSEYIYKVSYFKPSGAEARYLDALLLSSEARARPNAYYVDAIMIPRTAQGMNRPSQLAFLYYATTGDAYRKQNKDILQRIEQFNKDHVQAFTYVGAKLIP